MKNGIVKENGILIYYKNDAPCHAGAIKIDGKIYYAGRGGVIATGQHVVHGDMSNSVLKHGTYIFDENGVVKKESCRPKSLPLEETPLLREMSRSDRGFAVPARKRGTACGG